MSLRLPFLLLGLAGSAVAASADPRARIIADWEANRKRFGTVRYQLSGTLDMTDPTAGGSAAVKAKAPPASVHPISATVLIDITNKRFRIESSWPLPSIHDRNRWVHDFKVRTYDGKAYQTYLPRDKNERPEGEPDLGISTGDLNQLNVEASFWPVFAAHGFLSTRSRPMHPDRLPCEFEPDEFEYRGEGIQAGRRCAILQTEPVLNGHVELWADVERGSAIQRRIDFSHKTNPWYRFDVEHQPADGAWVPKSWTLAYALGRRVWQVEKMRVVKFEANPPVTDEDFTIPVTPGMLVRENKYPPRGAGLDPQRPALKNSRVTPTGGREVLDQTGYTTTDGVQLPPEGSWLRSWWWACSIGVLLLLAAVHYLRRRRSV